MCRWLGIDHGSRRIGVAAGNARDGIACPVAVIPAEPRACAIRQILELARDYEVVGIVVGWPLNMDDTEGPQCELARSMADELARSTQRPVRLWDERLSSFEAADLLGGRLSSKKRRGRRDAVAAAVILKDFFAGDGPDVAAAPHETTPPAHPGGQASDNRPEAEQAT